MDITQTSKSLRCNICGKAFDIFDFQMDFKIINPYIGYGSVHDGESCDLHMCCDCFDRVVGSMQFAVSPFKDFDTNLDAFAGQEGNWD